jgi:uncharacterized membrane protein YhaH (DUF805 family)
MKESIDWFMIALKKYAVFEGRARKKEYWCFILIYLLTLIPLSIIDFFTGTMNEALGLGFISATYMLLMLCPTLAVTCRRLHDMGKNGWWQLLNLVPLIGFFTILFFTVQDSQPADNEYGEGYIRHNAIPRIN